MALTLASPTLVGASADCDRCVEVNRWGDPTIPTWPELGDFHWIPIGILALTLPRFHGLKN